MNKFGRPVPKLWQIYRGWKFCISETNSFGKHVKPYLTLLLSSDKMLRSWKKVDFDENLNFYPMKVNIQSGKVLLAYAYFLFLLHLTSSTFFWSIYHFYASAQFICFYASVCIVHFCTTIEIWLIFNRRKLELLDNWQAIIKCLTIVNPTVFSNFKCRFGGVCISDENLCRHLISSDTKDSQRNKNSQLTCNYRCQLKFISTKFQCVCVSVSILSFALLFYNLRLTQLKLNRLNHLFWSFDFNVIPIA